MADQTKSINEQKLKALIKSEMIFIQTDSILAQRNAEMFQTISDLLGKTPYIKDIRWKKCYANQISKVLDLAPVDFHLLENLVDDAYLQLSKYETL